MDKNKMKTVAALGLCVGVLAVIVWSQIERPHRDVAAEPAQFKMVAQELVGFMASGDSSAVQYLNAVVELYAVVQADDGTRASFEGGVVAAWDTLQPHRPLDPGELLRVKGRVTGYDDLFEEVRMDGLVLVHDPDAGL